jgi:hypothetical protein
VESVALLLLGDVPVCPKEQTPRIKYTKLIKDQIDQKLAQMASGPACESEYSDF